MRYRITNRKGGFRLTVEDGEDVILSVDTKTKTEAQAIARKASRGGVASIDVKRAK